MGLAECILAIGALVMVSVACAWPYHFVIGALVFAVLFCACSYEDPPPIKDRDHKLEGWWDRYCGKPGPVAEELAGVERLRFLLGEGADTQNGR